ncbi:CDP-diacylglycerol--glycerol-3-phosphate 3-phosphatidyltransferase [Candidatus Methylospira mobilis]|uniref:CDP-diacylglycerol--glycerol-3-phosphate 3-phosphatidyltransferase n=1 Tax=Candidatus Methylospira mobilis TaxID=1808979 RepID=A0A5Q0BM44_9GAMM|nr:CDP-diacylglycerol--glycerol-3-phosphate 3-phosphatidyltransferase [Candidatus Methylospira mobilis]QFY43198.1 CDP-diacylglycerol--glycerol-3-phosphate 3-phosphatidyltransferase [Candidatus Methylospira mobilis]WNV03596.1 CDP-diacylglycerol--glycerol-3-phosphate 3-phosphatidyltransferase [Candidatus Methylospira mobilis]
MTINLPTSLTLLRILLIPVLIALFYLPWNYAHVACALVFGIAALTDWLDGYLARKLRLTTPFGAFLDPVADKLMVAVTLVLVVQADPNPWVAIASAVIIGREITIASLREWMAEIGQRKAVEVSAMGKWKTTAQMTAIIILLLAMDVFQHPLQLAGQYLLLLSAILTLWSMIQYMRAALDTLKD